MLKHWVNILIFNKKVKFANFYLFLFAKIVEKRSKSVIT